MQAGLQQASSDTDFSLVMRYRAWGDQRARARLTHRHQGLVLSLARRFSGRGEPLEDLVQEGFIGLLRAIDLYQPDKGCRFSSYAATKILSGIRHYLRDRGGLIRRPAGKQEVLSRVEQAKARLSQRLDRPPTPEELAADLRLSEEHVLSLLSRSEICRVQSLEDLCLSASGEDNHWEAFVAADEPPTATTPEDEIMLREALEALDGRQAEAVHLMFYEQLTCAETARRMGLSYGQARHLVNSALDRMRQAMGHVC